MRTYYVTFDEEQAKPFHLCKGETIVGNHLIIEAPHREEAYAELVYLYGRGGFNLHGNADGAGQCLGRICKGILLWSGDAAANHKANDFAPLCGLTWMEFNHMTRTQGDAFDTLKKMADSLGLDLRFRPLPQ